MIVGILNRPSFFNPVRHPERALRKRTEILYNLHKYEVLDRDEYDSINALPLGLKFNVTNQNEGPAPYFRKVAGNWLRDWAKDNGYDLYRDGLKIYTTIDSRLQIYAEEAVVEHMKVLQADFEEHWGGKDPWIDENWRPIRNFIENRKKNTIQYRQFVSQYGKDSDSVDIMMNTPVRMSIFSWEGEIDTLMSPIDSLKYYKRFLQTGFMAMDPHSGQVKAWVGGIDHKYFKYDHVKQGKRQPGSTFKPFVYTAAIEYGYTPCYKAKDVKITFELPGLDPPTWSPRNCCGDWTGEEMTLRQGLAKSVNSITAFLMKEVQPVNVVKYAHNMGIQSDLEPVPALCLGVNDVSLFELVGAYSTFVNKGFHNEPFFISRIEDKNGNVIQEFTTRSQESIKEETAYVMLHMLRGATEEQGGTAIGLSRELRMDNQIAAKTGTTNNASDGWFMGLTKDLVAGAWVGGDERSIHYKNWAKGSGARTALPIWDKFMTKVYNDSTLSYEKGPFPKPASRISIELNCDAYSDAYNAILAQDSTLQDSPDNFISEDDIQ
jgi:penicillin-binding protein 1A